MDETHVNFNVFDFDDDTSAVTQLLSIEPTKAWVAGDQFPNHPTAKLTHSRWVLGSGSGTEVAVEEQLEALLNLLEARREQVREAARRYSVEIQCAVYYEDFTPGINLSEQTIRRVADLGLSIDFDLYFLGNADSAGEEDQTSS